MEEFSEYITFTITTSEGQEVEMAVVDDTIDEEGLYIYKVKLGEEDFTVEKINNKVDYEKIASAYMEMGE